MAEAVIGEGVWSYDPGQTKGTSRRLLGECLWGWELARYSPSWHS